MWKCFLFLVGGEGVCLGVGVWMIGGDILRGWGIKEGDGLGFDMVFSLWFGLGKWFGGDLDLFFFMVNVRCLLVNGVIIWFYYFWDFEVVLLGVMIDVLFFFCFIGFGILFFLKRVYGEVDLFLWLFWSLRLMSLGFLVIL